MEIVFIRMQIDNDGNAASNALLKERKKKKNGITIHWGEKCSLCVLLFCYVQQEMRIVGTMFVLELFGRRKGTLISYNISMLLNNFHEYRIINY